MRRFKGAIWSACADVVVIVRDPSRGRSATSGVCAALESNGARAPGSSLRAVGRLGSFMRDPYIVVLGKAAVINASPGAETGEDTADDGCVLNPQYRYRLLTTMKIQVSWV